MTLDRNAEKQEVPINPETGKPYINTLAAVAISPAGASPEKSTYVAQAVYRTDVVIRLDIRPGFEGQIHAKQALVDEILSE